MTITMSQNGWRKEFVTPYILLVKTKVSFYHDPQIISDHVTFVRETPAFWLPNGIFAPKKCGHVIWLVVWNMNFMTFHSVAQFIIPTVIELDDGKKLQENPSNLMVKTHGFPVKIFPPKPIQWNWRTPSFFRGLGQPPTRLSSHY